MKILKMFKWIPMIIGAIILFIGLGIFVIGDALLQVGE